LSIDASDLCSLDGDHAGDDLVAGKDGILQASCRGRERL
jgi:hypothetical protein